MAWQLSLSELETAIQAGPLSTRATEYSGVGTDTRADLSGKIFFALKGDKHDAHQYLDGAVSAGAACLVIENLAEKFVDLKNRVTILKTADTLLALQKLARFWRHRHPIKAVALTGSNGKTTTKEFAATLLSRRYRTVWSRGSFNNHVGVPLSVLALDSESQAGVFEIGMNHKGEIENLTPIVDPLAVVVTMVGQAHIEHFGSVDSIAQAKEEIYSSCSPKAVRVFNADDPQTRPMWEKWKTKSQTLRFSSQDQSADICLKITDIQKNEMTITGHIAGQKDKAQVSFFGQHNLVNLMAAAGLAYSQQLAPGEIWQGFADCRTIWGRNQFVDLRSGARVLFDAYNANPESMRALVENARQLHYRKKIAVLGEMLEMGSEAERVHHELGQMVAQAGFDEVYFVGPHGADFARGMEEGPIGKKPVIFNSYEEKLAHALSPMLSPDTLIVVKASRGMQLERLVRALDPLNFN